MPHKDFLTVTAFLCDKVLEERDGVLSAIRIVDVFFFRRVPEMPEEKQAVVANLVILTKAQPGTTSEHAIKVDLLRPDGERVKVGESETTSMRAKFPEAPGGFNLSLTVGVKTKVPGLHFFIINLDDEEITRVPFTLIEQPPLPEHETATKN